MGLVDLFINSDEKKPESNVKNDKQPATSFPSNTTSFPSNTTSFPSSGTAFPSNVTTPVTTPQFGSQTTTDHIEKFRDIYRTSFDGLNQQGYDFYEFYQAIISANAIDNPQMYQMAFTMAMAMDKTISKAKLVEQSDFYINKLLEIYNQYVSSGNEKKNKLLNDKEAENHNLTTELSDLRTQFEAIKNAISIKENQLSMIDSKYQPLISEIDSKLNANMIMKDEIVNKLSRVKSGISNNIQ